MEQIQMQQFAGDELLALSAGPEQHKEPNRQWDEIDIFEALLGSFNGPGAYHGSDLDVAVCGGWTAGSFSWPGATQGEKLAVG